MSAMFNAAMQLTGKVKTRAMISCEECGREFQRNRKADLQRHMRIHTNEKPFICPYPKCGKAFRQSSALKNHSNFHQRDNSFTCEQCKMNFFDKPTFNRHVREKHELEHVYACTVSGCGKSFKRKPVFKNHMQDRHSISCSDAETANHRVPAGPYIKGTNGSRAVHHSGPSSSLPRLSDALQSIRPPQAPGTVYNQGVYDNSSSSPYAFGGVNDILLSDPYSKPSGAYSAATFVQGSGAPSDYGRYGTTATAADLWLPAQGSVCLAPTMNTGYYNGQIVAAPGAEYMNMGLAYSPAQSPQSVSPPHISFVYTSGTSSGSGAGSAGSYSPNSSFSRASSSSPVSAAGSFGNPYAVKPSVAYNNYVPPTSHCY
ncbi:hypothetical protein M0805_005760 [Coniferiporia weirii]|nr:hypothetical protein M0805_005760 [Coniferiporia weirii]